VSQPSGPKGKLLQVSASSLPCTAELLSTQRPGLAFPQPASSQCPRVPRAHAVLHAPGSLPSHPATTPPLLPPLSPPLPGCGCPWDSALTSCHASQDRQESGHERSLVIECVFDICKALGLIPSTTKKKKKMFSEWKPVTNHSSK
jgi:hypothetical protein